MGLTSIIHRIFPSKYTENSSWFWNKNRKYKYDPSKKEFSIEEGYASTLDVFTMVSFIAQKGSKLPIKVVIGDEEEEVTEGDLFDFINKPSSTISNQEFKELGLTFLLTDGNVIGFMNETSIGFGADEMILLYPQNTCVNAERKGKDVVPVSYSYTLLDTQFKAIDPEEISHIRMINPTSFGLNNYWGMSPLQAGYLTVISSQNLDVANASILDNRGVAGIMSNETEVIMTPEERKEAQEHLDKRMGGASDFGKVIQTGAKVKYQPIGLSPADLKIIESRVMKLRDMCNVYHMNSALFNDPANKIKSNGVEARKSAYEDAIVPALEKFLTLYDPIVKLHSENDNKDYRLKIDTSGVMALQEDKNEKAKRSKNIVQTIIPTLAGNLTPEQKIQTLAISLEISEDQAKKIVGDGQQPDQGTE